MTTLAVDNGRFYEQGDQNDFLVIPADIIYEGAAVGLVKATGLVQPLTSADTFVGFAQYKADNSASGTVYCKTSVRGRIQLPVTGAVITDVGVPVYAQDDNAFSFNPVAGTFIGFFDRYISAGVGIVKFDCMGSSEFRDPWLGWTHELKSANYTLDAEDTGKMLWTATDAFTYTLPAVATIIGKVGFGNIGAYGAVAITVSPNASDTLGGPDITAADDKDIVNTKATAQRGDFLLIMDGDATGRVVIGKRGVWTRQT